MIQLLRMAPGLCFHFRPRSRLTALGKNAQRNGEVEKFLPRKDILQRNDDDTHGLAQFKLVFSFKGSALAESVAVIKTFPPLQLSNKEQNLILTFESSFAGFQNPQSAGF